MFFFAIGKWFQVQVTAPPPATYARLKLVALDHRLIDFGAEKLQLKFEPRDLGGTGSSSTAQVADQKLNWEVM